MIVLAIDPGPVESAWVLWDGDSVLEAKIEPNPSLLKYMRDGVPLIMALPHRIAIEKITCYGMPVGEEVLETCVVTGQMKECWESHRTDEVIRIPRQQVKLHLCNSARAKDANVSQALKDRFGKPGTKKNPGVLFGISSHKWAALAVAVCAHDRLRIGIS